jgi:cob(I)alamin adenosyltransferase
MAIYTKKGDKGETGLFNQSKRIPKDDLQVEVLGTIDEANSFLGLATSFFSEQYLKNKITQIQRTLFRLGSIVAGAKVSIPDSIVSKYEKEIDIWTNSMPKLTNFIFPGGCQASAALFASRAVVRRLERLLVKLNNQKVIKPSILIYINRLSDYLFTLARYVNYINKEKEEIWEK